MRETNRTNILLVELLIVILFFMLAATTIVELYAAARQKSIHARAVNSAMLAAENLSERLYDDPDEEAELTASGFVFDAESGEWVLEKENYVLTAQVQETAKEAGILRTILLKAEREGQVLLELPSSRYLPGEVSP